ncbi:PRC-barrel domain protein [Catenulispora acidiphila DSM 44928]|uniref:PRC-barrel domain protein n=1 Tax=Catenulispora acidiphila (strain DSM 44928 / JCM 14897 / NBRC 102108 / NRRL B-24433 / ID139908) TaxID=479433 RepID=C7Q952_CATAD|nr:PRC-barrel domain protein [Catenulispora acidiphila DSM 44928]
MITSEQVRTVVDRAVCDSDGNKIGNAKHVFLDDVTGKPEWVSVKTGLFGTSESFVPIRDAAMVDDHLEVPFAKETVKKAPNVDVDAGGHLSEEEEHRLYEYYGIDWDAAWEQANQPGGVASGTASGTRTGTGTAAGTAAAAGGAAGMAGAAGAAGAAGSADERMRARDRGTAGDEAMIRSEERMHVGTERRESGRARLRKYVVTEEQEQTVPVRHEEVRVEREPISAADRNAAMSGTAISEDEREVTLHEERPVTEIETVPVERVRLTTEEVTEEKTVKGKVRKERIAAETDEDKDPRR